MVVVANRAHYQIGLEVDQVGGRIEQLAAATPFGGVVLRLRRAVDRFPDAQQVAQIPLDFLVGPADAGGAPDHAHALRNGQSVDDFLQFIAVLTLGPARHTAATSIVGHEHQVPASQADDRGEGSTLVAALILLDLDNEFLTFADSILDPCCRGVDPFTEIRARNLLERQEAMPLGAVFDERGFETGLDARDDRLVDIAFSLLFLGRLDIKVDELLAIDDGDAEFLGLRRVEQHALHSCSPARAAGRTKPDESRSQARGRRARKVCAGCVSESHQCGAYRRLHRILWGAGGWLGMSAAEPLRSQPLGDNGFALFRRAIKYHKHVHYRCFRHVDHADQRPSGERKQPLLWAS